MSVYIYTLPKAGTYFLAALLSNLGLRDTGYHMTPHHYLDTKKFSLQQNAETPGIAHVKKFFVPVLRGMEPNDVAFGHASLPFNRNVLPPHMKTICAYRHPRKTLVSEFVDFRFRRLDVPWVSRDTIPDDQLAFAHYLERHGTGPHLSIFKEIIRYHSLMTHPLTNAAEKETAIFINFESVLRNPEPTHRIAEFLGLSASVELAENARQKTLSEETKTKAVDVKVDRDALWSDRADEIFAASDFPRAIKVAQEQGLQV